MTSKKMLFSITFVFFIQSLSFGELLLKNGVNNLIDYETGTIRVESIEGAPTGITVNENGIVAGVFLQEDCYASVSGGTVSLLSGGDNSNISISGGDVLFGITANGYHSEVDISGGNILGTLSIGNHAISGPDYSSLNISGGTLGRINISYAGIANITSGIIDEISTSGEVTISGGQISSILAGESGVVLLHGSGFLLDGFEITSNLLADGSYIKNGNPVTKRLTGTLLNGESLDVDLFLGGNSQLQIIPEPATLLLFGVGGLVVRRRLSGRV